ncbi:MAG: ClpXP protease specificity-enhancing factor [Halomonadaceae bacterium]|nr:MAG: ClpXP protease specificity-enhancing factor [Halomonadaceae bacterium]
MSKVAATMTSSRAYLIRALNQWILDNGNTPHIVVDAGVQDVEVPQNYVSNGQIVLNISASAVQQLAVDNEALSFSARFGGVPMQVWVPIRAVMAIYAKENGQGMVFGHEPGSPDPDQESPLKGESQSAPQSDEKASKKPTLTVVK